MASPEATRWHIDTTAGGIVWDVADTANPANTLPHADHVEMSGRRISVIVRYRVDEQRRLFVERDIFFPQLRVRENDVRGYLRRVYDDKFILPRFLINGKEWFPSYTPIGSVHFCDHVSFDYPNLNHECLPDIYGDLVISRGLFPCRDMACVYEHWLFWNRGKEAYAIDVLPRRVTEVEHGVEGKIKITTEILSRTALPITLTSGMAADVSLVTYADTLSQPSGKPPVNPNRELVKRIERFKPPKSKSAYVTFDCPDSEINQLFAFAKLRAAESLFETDLMGLVHSPGGGNYYGGIWANDQCEYSGPFFAFLNDPAANEAAINAYRHYAKHMGPDYAPVPTSFEMGGHIPYHAGGDRGDAAMIASGMARYLLVLGNRELADELYPALQWCNEYSRRKTDARGIVLSDTDELEGRFPTGDANLSTATLAYDGYRMGAHVARGLGRDRDAAQWTHYADTLATAIENHFGARVEGYETYRYYDGNDVLRSWICLPLVFGLAQGTRKAGTLDALFSPRLWTPDGLATQAGDTTFWDRSTLYGLRGAFIAGATEPAYEHLLAYSRRRLLGDHVPYPVEAYPENAQAHLSAESALYCRVFLEGLLGIVPTGFDSFTLTPRLPKAWNEYSVRFTAFGGRDISIRVEREKDQGKVSVVAMKDGSDTHLYSASGSESGTQAIDLGRP